MLKFNLIIFFLIFTSFPLISNCNEQLLSKIDMARCSAQTDFSTHKSCDPIKPDIFTDKDFQNFPQPFATSNITNQIFIDDLMATSKTGSKSLQLEDFGIIQLDNQIPPELAERFKKNILQLQAKLMNSPINYEEHSTHTIFTLTNPAMYPFVSGVTRIRNNFVTSNATQDQLMIGYIPKLDYPIDYSTRFQMLPTEVNIDRNGQVQLTSYINNINPEQSPGLYKDIQEIIQIGFIPSFEKVMKTFLPKLAKNKILARQKLQMVFNLKSIHLDPIKSDVPPSCPGTDYHIEGLRNENILMSAIYYFNIENLSEQRLSFGMYKSNVTDNNILEINEDEIDEIGSIKTENGRIVAFPNTLYHKLLPFTLLNNATVGYRYMFLAFLIDPLSPMISTANVPPQQLSWYKNFNIELTCPYTIEKAVQFKKHFYQERRKRGCRRSD